MSTPLRVQTRPVKLGAGSTNFSDSFASLPAIGSYIVVAQTSGGSTTTGDVVSDNQSPPNTYTKKVSQTGVALWGAWVGTSAGTFTITDNASNSSGNSFQITEWSGVDPTTPIDGTPGTATQAGFSFTSLTCGAGTSTQKNDVILLLSQTGTSGNTPTYSGNMSLVASDVTNGTSSTLSLGQGTVNSIGAQTGSVSWPSATNYDAVALLLKGIPEPTITVQPTNQSVVLGSTATLSVTATAPVGSPTYQWQLDSGSGFSNISGATSSTYTTAGLAYSDNVKKYQVIVTDSSNGQSTTSNVVRALADTNTTGTPGVRHYSAFGAGPFGNGAFGPTLKGKPSSGSTVTGTASEAGTAADTSSALGAFTAARVEAGTAADSPSASGVLLSAVTESATGVDISTGSITTSAATSEAGTAADSGSTTNSTTASTTEAGTAADTSTALGAFTAARAEAGTAADTSSASDSTTASTTESGTAADTSSTAGTTSATITEAGTAADGTSGVLGALASTSEAGAATDTSTGSTTTSATTTESGTAADSSDTTGTLNATMTESGTGADTSSVSDSTTATTTESGTGADTSSATDSTTASIAEQAAAADTSTNSALATASVTESAPMTETTLATSGNSVVAFEAGDANDTSSSIYSTGASVTEHATGADTSGSTQAASTSTTEQAAGVDIPTGSIVTTGAITEAAFAVDTSDVTGSSVITASVTEQGAALDSPAFLPATLHALMSEIMALHDTVRYEFGADYLLDISEIIPLLLNLLVDGRVWQDSTPDDIPRSGGAFLPFILWTVMGGQDQEYLDQTEGDYSNARVQIHTCHPSILGAATLAMQVRDVLLASPYTVGVLGSPIGTYDAARRLRGKRQQFSIWFRQSPT